VDAFFAFQCLALVRLNERPPFCQRSEAEGRECSIIKQPKGAVQRRWTDRLFLKDRRSGHRCTGRER